MSDLTDALTINTVGRGAWYALHLLCAAAITNQQKDACLILINLYRTNFICVICQEHFNEYAERDPPENYYNIDNGLAKWSWKAHNNANRVKGRGEISWAKFEDLYLQKEEEYAPCSECVADRFSTFSAYNMEPPSEVPLPSTGYRIIQAPP